MLILSRQSGLPVNPEKLENYKDEWRNLFDKAMEEIKDMQNLTEYLNTLEIELKAKHEMEVKLRLPKSEKSLREMLDKYGPIMYGLDHDGNLRAVIMDQES